MIKISIKNIPFDITVTKGKTLFHVSVRDDFTIHTYLFNRIDWSYFETFQEIIFQTFDWNVLKMNHTKERNWPFKIYVISSKFFNRKKNYIRCNYRLLLLTTSLQADWAENSFGNDPWRMKAFHLDDLNFWLSIFACRCIIYFFDQIGIRFVVRIWIAT